eukprot:165586-Chlamydomonas_euryale.AAC.1
MKFLRTCVAVATRAMCRDKLCYAARAYVRLARGQVDARAVGARAGEHEWACVPEQACGANRHVCANRRRPETGVWREQASGSECACVMPCMHICVHAPSLWKANFHMCRLLTSCMTAAAHHPSKHG